MHHHHHRHRHHHHSGCTPTPLPGEPQAHTAAQDALQTCLRAVRGLDSQRTREAVLGLLAATLAHERLISGLEAPHTVAMTKMNHYGIEIE